VYLNYIGTVSIDLTNRRRSCNPPLAAVTVRPYRPTVFTARCYAERGIAMAKSSVCLAVCDVEVS